MRKFALLVGICWAAGCGNTFETPLSADQPEVIVKVPGITNLWGHGMTATDPDGSLRWICETQPRMYSDGEYVVDHYIADSPCPLRPID